MRDLLDVRQRESTADVVNHAMLAVQPAPPWHSFGRQPPWAPPKKLVSRPTMASWRPGICMFTNHFRPYEGVWATMHAECPVPGCMLSMS